MHPGAAVNRVTLLRSVVQTKLGPANVRNRRVSAGGGVVAERQLPTPETDFSTRRLILS
jgi:hypothetical protein